MKKVLLFFIVCCLSMGASAQFVINAWGNIEFTPSTTNAWTNHFVTYAGNAYAKNYVVSWDGTHRFWVLGNGNVFAVNSYLTSDERMKLNINNVSDASGIYKLTPKTYYLKDSLNDKSVENKTIQYGFLAQEVQKIYPEMVFTDGDGMLSLNYTAIIPLLVKTVQQQHAEIENLKTQIAQSSSSAELKSSSLFTEEKTTDSPASLSQNKPNPFSSETRIEMFVPKSVANATLYVYDLQGKQVKSITVTGRGATFETIHGSELQAGLYIYSLVTDGKLVGSKQMVLTE